jgi:Copper transport outer membrane protein, MctB
MIDFRYHVVSIVAVFLALTVGLVLGASFLKPAALDGLHSEISSLNQDKSTLEQQQRLLDSDNSRLDQYIDQTAGTLVNTQLAGQSVSVVRISGSDDPATDATLKLIKQADATITSDITITAAFTDPASTQQLAQLVAQYTPSGQSTLAGSTLDQAVNLLSDALTAPTGSASAVLGAPHTGMTDAEAVAALKGFAAAGLITITTPPTGEANSGPDVAFIAAPTGASSDVQNTTYLQLAQDLHASGAGPVVGAPAGAAAAGGLISAVLASATATKDVSTVDDLDQTIGQVALVFAAFQEATDEASAGHYGTTGTTDGVLPKLPTLPTPAAN